MARHLFFAITLIGIGVLLNSPAEAVTDAPRCEDRAANCVGRCANPDGGANQNKCIVVLRPGSDQLFDTRAWRGPAVVGGDGIEPSTSTELAEHDPSRCRLRGDPDAALRQPWLRQTTRRANFRFRRRANHR